MESVETQEIIFVISEAIDFVGVAIIALGALIGVILCARDLLRQERAVDAYSRLRTFLGRSLLLGLEFLVAGDIIKTVAIEPTFDSVIVLAIIVLVRTVLSLSIDVEIDGRWPWQAAQQASLVEASPAGTSEIPRRRDERCRRRRLAGIELVPVVVWSDIGIDEARDVAFDGEREASVLAAKRIQFRFMHHGIIPSRCRGLPGHPIAVV